MRIFEAANFRQDDSEFRLTRRPRERFDETSWRNFVEFSREQRTKDTEFRLHFFCTVLYSHITSSPGAFFLGNL